ncbi:hypothetical protein MASR2M39_29660 [Ignavibacteriales bacterium]
MAFDKLKELGLTNLVTEGLYNLSITDTNNIFLLNDMGFAWNMTYRYLYQGISNPSGIYESSRACR